MPTLQHAELVPERDTSICEAAPERTELRTVSTSKTSADIIGQKRNHARPRHQPPQPSGIVSRYNVSPGMK